ncbi:LuxR family transcriptional regulator [Planotetraspora thailandica]|uniref:LuxR family transcriptional regulator n=1 Tax=Planotetraspora thailandica TaxID=487172 RepID=A0A8J3V2D8_9ACTN|nr:LuxR C-terminal-related transcriptional regulator [Planotetraspora thailandica]GII53761.1 LuxR family transcriptional regulator [Planotetraspora thailandica]
MAGTAFARQVGNLPADVTSFVGRRQELAEIRRLLSVSRLVTLTGVGGVGKTRLALRAASDQHRAFDAVWLVDLSVLDDPSLVAPAIAETVGLRDQTTESPMRALSAFLAARRTLLVLDNCEHVLDATAELADCLLRAAPELRILATSRRSLGITGERTMPVAPLPVPGPNGRRTLKSLERYDAVTLFADRAAAVLPGFTLDEDNGEAVAALCRRLDGIPLAIELAAVRLRTLSVGGLVERLSDRYRWLTGGSRTAPPRQRTLQALIDWSFQLLPACERALWTRMAIFPGHFDLDAVEAVCSGGDVGRDDVLDLVDALVDASMVLREEHDGAVRYRVLETLREFALARLGGVDSEECGMLARRHRDWYGTLVRQAAGDWFGPRQVAWFFRLRLEEANLMAALESCLREPGEAETGLRLAFDLYRTHWLPASLFIQGRQWLTRMLEAAPRPSAVRAQVLCAAASMAFAQSDAATGEPLLREATNLARELGDPASGALACMVAGKAARDAGEFDRAAPLLEEAAERLTACGDLSGLASALLALADTSSCLGDDERAEGLFKRGLDLSAAHEESWCRAWTLTIFAVHLWGRVRDAEALAAARESLPLARAFDGGAVGGAAGREASDGRLSLATSIEVIAWILTGQGQHVRAARLLGAAEAIAGEAGVSTARMGRYAEHHEQCASALQEALGGKGFARATHHGGRLSVDQAVAEALGDEPAREEAGEAASDTSPLTARELEIAELIAQGLSNKEIAAALVVAQRTAEGHVEHILAKLGYTSRAQIAAWMTARKSTPAPPPPRA